MFHRSVVQLSFVRACRPLLVCAALGCRTGLAADKEWPGYLGDKARSRFSTLKQIQAGNVDRLEVASTYHSGDARADNQSQIQCNPIVVDGILYGTTAQLKLI